MKELENFYNNNYKTDQMMDWSELTDKQKKALENSREYWSFQFNKALVDFKNACKIEVEKLKTMKKKDLLFTGITVLIIGLASFIIGIGFFTVVWLIVKLF